MRTRVWAGMAWLLVIGLAAPAAVRAQVMKDIQLPKPRLEGGKPLMQALAARSTSREFGDRELPLQVLSDLLWAADGINRPDTGKRTAPSAMNVQNIDIYAALKSGLYMYDAKGHCLKPVLSDDVRAATGRQEFVKAVPLNLVYVADLAKVSGGTDEDKILYSAAHVGFIGQNVYLFCASAGLNAWFYGTDREGLAKALNLRPGQRVLYGQAVGFPKKS